MITMSKSDYEIILKHARENLPEEACGLVAGKKEGKDKFIEKVYCLTNIFHWIQKSSWQQLRICVPTVWYLWVTGIPIRKVHPDHPKKIRDWLMTAQQAI